MKKRILRFSVSFFLMYALWGFITTNTVFASSALVYISMVILLLCFGYLFIHYGKLNNNWQAMLWIPFLGYSILCWFLNLKLEFIVYLFSCLTIIAIAGNIKLREYIPQKLLVFSGLFAFVGIIIQLFFPSVYNSYIFPLFTNSESLSFWMDSEYGFAGFTYQLASTANILLMAEAFWLYASDKIKIAQKKWIFWSVLVILIAGIFLAGKRTHSTMAIVLPVLLYTLSRRNLSKIVLTLIFVGSIAFFVGSYFVEHAEEYSDTLFVKRFAESVIELQSGEDITSNRSNLSKEALRLSGSMFGIGIGEFKNRSVYQMDAHQTYYQVLCELGIFGFILFVTPIIFCFVRTFKLHRKYKGQSNILKLSLFLQLYFILYSFTGNTMNDMANYFFYFLAIGLFIDVEMHGEQMRQNHDKKNISTL